MMSSDHDDDHDADVAVIDGSEGEGGGQILRNAICFATLLGRELIVNRIRAKRSNPGLRAQHVTSMSLAAQIVEDGGNDSGTIHGNRIGSTEIHYQPPSIFRTETDRQRQAQQRTQHHRSFTGDTKTAGSICLLLQAALPCALLDCSRCNTNHDAPKPTTTTTPSIPTTTTHLILKGGTNATMAPQFDYWEHVFWPTLRDRCGLSNDQVTWNIIRRGYFPRGGGEVHLDIRRMEGPLNPIHITNRGDVRHIWIRSFHAGPKFSRNLAVKMADAAQSYLKQHVVIHEGEHCDYVVDIVAESSAVGNGCGILIVATTTTGCRLAGSALYDPKTKRQQAAVEETGIAAATELCSTLGEGGCVDDWLQDQLVLYMALARGRSEIVTGSLTMHTRTAIAVAEQLTSARFQIVPLLDSDNSPADAATNNLPNHDDDGGGGGGGGGGASSSSLYGQIGRVSGKHKITCYGIS